MNRSPMSFFFFVRAFFKKMGLKNNWLKHKRGPLRRECANMRPLMARQRMTFKGDISRESLAEVQGQYRYV